MKKIFLSVMILTSLAACSTDQHEDLKQWMKDQEKNAKGKIESLPEAKTYTPMVFSAQHNPFVSKPVVSLSDLMKNKYAPAQDRRKEPLEEYPLEALKMVGSVDKDKKTYAMVSDPNKIIHYVTLGNYLGNNYGEIVQINESEIVLQERVKEDDEWKLKANRIFLSEKESTKRGK